MVQKRQTQDYQAHLLVSTLQAAIPHDTLFAHLPAERHWEVFFACMNANRVLVAVCIEAKAIAPSALKSNILTKRLKNSSDRALILQNKRPALFN